MLRFLLSVGQGGENSNFSEEDINLLFDENLN